jgi:P4 family phage/plasmid primase-like protien
MARKPTAKSFDLELVRSAAARRWPEILSRLGGQSDELFDGRKHPCPKCGGTDRFRMIDADAGAVLCNQCLREKNGDGFAALQWLLGVDFRASLERIAGYLGIEPSANGRRRKGKATAKEGDVDPAENLKFLAWNEGLAETWRVLHKPGIKPAAMLAAGCRLARYRDQFTVFALPVYGPKLAAADPVGWCLYNAGGGTLPTWSDGVRSQVKTKLTCGSKPGLIGPVEKLGTATEVWILEGPSDLLTFLSLDDLPSNVTAFTNANGAGKTPEPWMAKVCSSKAACVLYDADQPGQDGAATWSESIAKEASTCLHVRLPYPIREAHTDLPNDLRDWVREGNAYADLAKLRNEAAPIEKPADVVLTQTAENPAAGSEKEAEPEDPGAIKLIADHITLFSKFAQDAGGRLFRYVDGVYRSRADAFVKREVKRLCHSLDLTSRWSSRLATEVCEYIRVDAPELWATPPVDVINVENGLLNLTTATLAEHSPDHLSAIRLPIKYEPAATCPALEQFVAETFPVDARDLAWEIAAWLMVPDLSIQKAILLVGEGGNGKSRYLAWLQAFLGKENTSGLSLHKLESDRFCVARIISKLANICPDLPSEHLASTSIFKAVTGGDSLVAEHKFRDSFEVRPFARLVFSANHLPQSRDGSHGFFRRWLVIPFNRTFAPAEQIDQATLDAMLSTPGELSGLLNKAIVARRRLDSQQGFSEPKSVADAATDFLATTDPLAVWLDRHTIEDPDMHVTQAALRLAYNEAARRDGHPTMNSTAFGRAVKRLRPTLREGQRTIKKSWSYLGIGLIDHHQDQSHDSRGSLSSPLLTPHTRERGNGEGGSNGSQTEEGAGDGTTGNGEQVRGNGVNQVNGVTCDHDYQAVAIEGDRERVACTRCGKFYGYQPRPAAALRGTA